MSQIPKETIELIDLLIDGTIGDEQSETLQRIMLEDKQVRLEYLKRAQFDSSMQFYAHSIQEHDTIPAPGASISSTNSSAGFLSRAIPIIACVALLLILAIGLGQLALPQGEDKATLAPLRLVSYVGTQKLWEGVKELTGKVSVEEGVLTFQTQGGCLMSLEGPSEFELTAKNVGLLTNGKIVVFCGENTEKFTVETDSGSYVDLGTEFGVTIEEGGSSLHVFDGQVVAKEANGNGTQVVEGATAIRSGEDGISSERSLVDFASFDRLRSSLSSGTIVQNFDQESFHIKAKEGFETWNLNAFRLAPGAIGRVVDNNPLAEKLQGCLTVSGETSKDVEEGVLAFLEAEWDYAHGQSIDVTKAHTIECLVRFDCDPMDVVDFSIYGSERTTWKNRSWSVGANQINGRLMWNVFNSSQTVGSDKFQHLAIENKTPFHVLVEIDPEIAKFRTTVSDGHQRIWNELYDGSPVSLKPEPLEKLFWRIRGKAGSKLSFSIDAIQVRNRPVFENVSSTED